MEEGSCSSRWVCMHAQSLSGVQLFVASWTVVIQAPLSMGFSRQEYRSGLPCPPPGNISNLEIEPTSPASPALAGGFFFFPLPHLGCPVQDGKSPVFQIRLVLPRGRVLVFSKLPLHVVSTDPDIWKCQIMYLFFYCSISLCIY